MESQLLLKKPKGNQEGIFYFDGAIYDLPVSGLAKLIYLFLCSYATKHGKETFPSLEEISEACKTKSHKRIDSALKELEKAGMVPIQLKDEDEA